MSWVELCNIILNNLDDSYFKKLSSTIFKDETMPLISGKAAKTKKGFSENIRREREAGKPEKQAVAIAFSKKREASSKKRKKR